MIELLSRIGLEEAAGEAVQTTEESGGLFGSMNNMMSIFMIVIGVFILYSAVTGKGPAYKNDYPAAMQEEHKRMLRIFCWIAGPIAVISGVLEYLGYEIVFWISSGIIFTAIVVYVILFRRKFKKYL